ncbi:hypothetical protein BCV69DRAFT_42762 [Microstroma glucosiphilum]|uniref:Uncharacterized protein n=1 Tax=Pseudomicrostroma glucosiphilum TaxID=1684307 RepID=A0A316U986_9BASI|nr:hypothetical protein BCV69DRAFT_42762 [Pseudomicrostroma glucosiphilum]PWN19555.1 hypothetical protein BCV69DRAFT_42762 [Pseudomicrostroma glucosiphilum]
MTEDVCSCVRTSMPASRASVSIMLFIRQSRDLKFEILVVVVDDDDDDVDGWYKYKVLTSSSSSSPSLASASASLSTPPFLLSTTRQKFPFWKRRRVIRLCSCYPLRQP